MRAFLYTSCPTGKRADDPRPSVGGYGVRAWTAGSSKVQLEPILRLCGCEFPPGGGTRRLAFVRQDGVPALLHSTPNAADEVGRGVPFTHAVAELPADFDPLAAVRTWGSAAWRTTYPADADTTLADPPAVPTPGPLDDAGLAAALADPKVRETARYVLAAALAPTPPAKTYVYAPAEHVAWVVYAAARAAPPAVRRELTFSTYEKNLLYFPARVVGTYGDAREDDLPRACYQTGGAAINSGAGRTGARFDSTYATLAVGWLASGNAARVDAFLARAAALGVVDGGLLGDLAALDHEPNALDAAAVGRLLADQRTAAEVVRSEAATAAVVGWATDPAGPAGDLLPALLRAAHAARGSIVQRVEDAALAAAADPTPHRLTHVLARLRAADPAREKEFGRTAAARLTPATLAWPVRLAILPLLRDDPADAWLSADEPGLADLLNLKLPPAWEVRAVAAVAARAPVTSDAVVGWLTARPERLRDVARAVADPAERLAAAFARADARQLLDAFEADGGTVPEVVLRRVLAERRLARASLARRSVAAHLAATPAALTKVVEEAAADQQATEVLNPTLVAAVGRDELARCAADVGWEALKAGRVAAAKFAFERLLPELRGADALPAQVAKARVGEYGAEAQSYLIGYALGRKDTAQVAAWLPALSPPLLGHLLTTTSATDDLKLRAVEESASRVGRLPDGLTGTGVPVSLVVEALKRLQTRPGSEALAGELLGAQAAHVPREPELRSALLATARTDPRVWPLVDRLLGRWVNTNPDRAAEALGVTVAAEYGLTDTVAGLVRVVLNRPDPPAPGTPEYRLLEAVPKAHPRGGKLAEEERTHVTYLLRRENPPTKGADMLSWLLGLLGGGDGAPSAAMNKHTAADLPRQLGAKLLNNSGKGLAAALDGVLATRRQPFPGRAELLQAVLKWVAAEHSARFFADPEAVAACLAVCFGAAGGSGRPGNPDLMRQLAGWLCEHLYASGSEYAFFAVFRATGGWPADAVEKLADGYTRAAEAADRRSAQAAAKPTQAEQSWWKKLWN